MTARGRRGVKGGFVYTRDSVHASKHPESDCASCHQPEPWLKKPFSALESWPPASVEAKRGISCEVCHKIAHVDPTKPNFPGLYPATVTVLRRPAATAPPVQFGLLADATFSAPQMRASYQPQLEALVCATCHQDKNDPDGDGDFEENNGVISEPTYLEWLNSPYADPNSPKHATCVDCHMKATNALQACSVLDPPLNRPPGDVRNHSFPGTTSDFLDNAVSMTLAAKVLDNRLETTVILTNDKTGHYVPTGVTIRNMILLVEAIEVDSGKKLKHTGQQKVHALGGVGDPEKGYYAGLAGKLYAKINQDAKGTSPTFFTDAVSIKADNRLKPLEKDTTSYSFDLSTAKGSVEVRARLIYRRTWRALLDAKKWTLDGHGNPLEDIQAPHFGHLMEEVKESLTVPTPCDGGECSDGGFDAGAGGKGTLNGPAKRRSIEGGGCSCRASASSFDNGMWAWALLLLVGRSRRFAARRSANDVDSVDAAEVQAQEVRLGKPGCFPY